MNITNKSNLDFADEYILNYQNTIEKKYPELSRQKIEIEIDNGNVLPETEPMVADNPKGIDTINCVRILVNINYGGVTDNLSNRFNKKEELFALLSHEIGHIVASYNGKASSDNEEEIYADSCAQELGLGAPMIEAIKKMKDDYNNSPVKFFGGFMSGLKYSPENMDKRIEELAKKRKNRCQLKSFIKSFFK